MLIFGRELMLRKLLAVLPLVLMLAAPAYAAELEKNIMTGGARAFLFNGRFHRNDSRLLFVEPEAKFVHVQTTESRQITPKRVSPLEDLVFCHFNGLTLTPFDAVESPQSFPPQPVGVRRFFKPAVAHQK